MNGADLDRWACTSAALPSIEDPAVTPPAPPPLPTEQDLTHCALVAALTAHETY